MHDAAHRMPASTTSAHSWPLSISQQASWNVWKDAKSISSLSPPWASWLSPQYSYHERMLVQACIRAGVPATQSSHHSQ